MLAIPLGLGTLMLAAAVAGGVAYLALKWVSRAPLLAMTVGVHGAAALIMACFGVITMSMRCAVSTGQLERRSATAIRRNLLVLWNLGLLMTCLGWLGFATGISLARVQISTPTVLTGLLLPALLLGYGGTVVVLASRLLRD